MARIVVDTSALMAVALREPEADRCIAALSDTDELLIAAPTLTETLIVATGRNIVEAMQATLDRLAPTVIDLTAKRASAAAAAYRHYGKGWHAAGLNFGDCFAYAAAKEHGCPLLYIGDDFAKTDIEPAIA